MRRIFVGITNSALLLFSVLLLVACGGGGGDGPKVSNAAVGGLWQGQVTISGQGEYELMGVIAEDGRGYFLQEDGVMYWGTVKSSGNKITSTMTGAGIYALPLWDGSSSGTGSLEGTIQARASIAASSDFTTALGARTTATISVSYAVLYDDDSSLASIAGSYADFVGIYSGILNISSSGDLFLQDPDSGCVMNGTFAIINPAFNAYDVQLSYASCTGEFADLNGVTFSGLAVYDKDWEELYLFTHGTVGGAPYAMLYDFYRP
jgi:hypothetical protein